MLAAGALTLVVVSIAASQGVKSLSNTTSVRNVYLVAHQDDWQVFMGDVVVDSMKSGGTATFIYLTAGDDGRDSVYWATRERAALASTRLAARTDSSLGGIDCRAIQVRGHAIRRCLLGRTESYFLRLPDGKRNGAGFPRYANQSMRRLRARKIPAMTAVDGSTTYHGWEDLVSTVGELINSGEGAALVHTTDPSVATNPHDHFDHRDAGLMVSQLRTQMSLGARYYVGYALATRAANRTNEQAREKTAVFLAYNDEMMRTSKSWSAYREHPGFYANSMARTFARSPKSK